MLSSYIQALKNEFHGYNSAKLLKDILAGLTVAAVALPLALAFGVSSGADGAAGLITAIIAGLLIGTLSGASYQISGPTGAMSAILISLSQVYGLQGVFVASFMSGVLLLIASLLKFGKVVSFIPVSVITGFTSGIAILIALQQVNNFFGVTSAGTSSLDKLFSYFDGRFTPDMQTVLIGVLVIVLMVIYPKKWNSIIPSSLMAIIVMLVANLVLNMDVAVVGQIPSTLLPKHRLDLGSLNFDYCRNLLMPAFSIAALGMIESLLCGASAGKMKNEKLNANQELLAQGIGNMIIPFFGGVPATAAIARTSVAIKAGAVTRLVSVFHSVTLLLAMFILGPYMARIPLSALAGVLIVTAWRMNDFCEIGNMFKNGVKTPIIQFLMTMIATVVFDLTMAIIIGIIAAMLLYIVNSSELKIDMSKVDTARMKDLNHHHLDTRVMYVSGPLFFANQGKLLAQVEMIIPEVNSLVISMRGVPSIDDSGIGELKEIFDCCQRHDVHVVFSGIQHNVLMQLERVHFYDEVGEENFYWDASEALRVLDCQIHQDLKNA